MPRQPRGQDRLGRELAWVRCPEDSTSEKQHEKARGRGTYVELRYHGSHNLVRRVPEREHGNKDHLYDKVQHSTLHNDRRCAESEGLLPLERRDSVDDGAAGHVPDPSDDEGRQDEVGTEGEDIGSKHERVECRGRLGGRGVDSEKKVNSNAETCCGLWSIQRRK